MEQKKLHGMHLAPQRESNAPGSTVHASRHVPVLLREVLEVLSPKPGDFVIDGTLGGGGYAQAILRRLEGKGRFLGVDWSTDASVRGAATLASFESAELVLSLANLNFARIPEFLESQNLGLADSLVLDLGLSSDAIESSGRGFSFKHDEPLIMTYSDDVLPVREVLRELSEGELSDVIRERSDERFAGPIARAIQNAGRRKTIETTGELASIIRAAVPKGYERGRIDPATRTFMALRMYANREIENIQELTRNVCRVVRPGGRVAVVSFHSTEDGAVKREFRALALKELARLINKKPIVASREEVALNPRSRSAKLRGIEIMSN